MQCSPAVSEICCTCLLQGGDLLDWTSDKGIQMDAFIQRIDALSTMGCALDVDAGTEFAFH